MKHKLFPALLAVAGLFAADLANAEISDNIVKIGVLTDMSGPYAGIGGPGSVVAAKMAVEDYLKATHSKLKIEVISADHQNKPDIGASLARKWYDSEGVDAIVDVPTSSIALAVNQITREKGKALFVTTAGATDLTGKDCSPNTVHWVYDTWMTAHGTGSAVLKQGGDTWFFLTADYAFGHSMEANTTEVIKAAGGKVLGSVKVPMGMKDFSSALLQAQASGAKIIGLANGGTDMINSVKQASEFGIGQNNQKIASLIMFLSEVHSLGLQSAQGLLATTSFYWDLNEGTRAWAKRFAAANGGTYPTMSHAGAYSAVLHYLKAVDALQSDDGTKVVAKMKEMPTDDPLFGKGSIRADGRKIHPVYLAEVKKPSESKGPYDYYKILQTIPADQAFRPMNEGGCPLVKN